jgi:hypothetical protein
LVATDQTFGTFELTRTFISPFYSLCSTQQQLTDTKQQPHNQTIKKTGNHQQEDKMRLKYLRTKPRKVVEASPCIAEMGAMIQCWTASGVDDAKCMQTAKMLADCMKNLVRSIDQTGAFDVVSVGDLDRSSWQLRPRTALFRNGIITWI